MRKQLQRLRATLGFALLTMASCAFPELPFALELLAGDIGGAGNVDGTGSGASFYFPVGVAVGSNGTVYVADFSSHTIRKVTAAGVVTTIAGTAGMSGAYDATGVEARFNLPTGIAAGSDGTLYISEWYAHTIRKITKEGKVTTLAGTAWLSGSTTNAIGTAARFNQPNGVAVDSSGTVYVADGNNHTIRMIRMTERGAEVTTLAGTAGVKGSENGDGEAARFNGPFGVAVDGRGNVYVADRGNHTIRKIRMTGTTAEVTTLAGTAGMPGSTDARGTDARFSSPAGIAVDRNGTIYVADWDNHTIRAINEQGDVTTLAGTAGEYGSDDDGSDDAPSARFLLPSAVAVDNDGKLYVADEYNHTIRSITKEGSVSVVRTLAGNRRRVGIANGQGADARFFGPRGVAADGNGNIYVADVHNHTIRKVSPDRYVTTLAGTPGSAGYIDTSDTRADTSATGAKFQHPMGVAVDSAGIVYVADLNNQVIRRVGVDGHVDTWAGRALFNYPRGVAVDSSGNAYVVDYEHHVIRKVGADGRVETLAGTDGIAGSSDGMGAATLFNRPSDVAVDDTGNVYVADLYNGTIRKISKEGNVTTLAGAAGNHGHEDGEGESAHFGAPCGIAVDRTGNVFVADEGWSTIRKITPTGTTTTIAGKPGVARIVLGATPQFAYPQRLAVVGDSLVITDGEALLLLRHGAR